MNTEEIERRAALTYPYQYPYADPSHPGNEAIPRLRMAFVAGAVCASAMGATREICWIPCILDLPPDGEDVLVTDGTDWTIGDYNRKRRERDGKWSVIYDGSVRVSPDKIVAWTFAPSIPRELLGAVRKLLGAVKE